MKSYFNVPDNINSSNRHLGTERNTRGKRPENRAKKQNILRKFKYENDKRIMRMWNESINEMMNKIAYLQEMNYYLKIEEQQRIIDIENEKEQQRKQLEIQKEEDIINHNKMIDYYSNQLSLLPEYREYIKSLNEENQKIIAQEKIIAEQLAIEKSDEEKKIYQIYFDTIKQKKIDNDEKILQLEIINNNKARMQKYIDNHNAYLSRSIDIYNKSTEIIQNIAKTKLEKQEAIDNWNYNLELYNDYIVQINLNYENAQKAKEKEDAIQKHNEQLKTISDYINNIENQLHLKYIELNTVKEEDHNEIEISDDIQIDNSNYIKYYSDALDDLKKYSEFNRNQIEQSKLIQKQKEEETIRLRTQYINNEIKNIKYKQIEFAKHNKYLYEQRILLQQTREEEHKKRVAEKKHEHNIQVQYYTNKINQFNIDKQQYIESNKRKLILIKKQEEFDKQQKEKSRLILKERESFNNHLIELNEKIIIDRKKQINEEKIKYENYIKLIEEEKRQQLLKDKQDEEAIKLKKELQQKLLLRIHNIQNDIFDNINQQQFEEEQKKINDKIKRDRDINLQSIYKSQLQHIKDSILYKEQLELEKAEEEIRRLELIEHNKNDHRIKQQLFYEKMLHDNHENFVQFKQHQAELEKQQQLELEKQLKESEDIIIQDNVNYAIESILDIVNNEIDVIEHNNKILFYNQQIALQKEEYDQYCKQVEDNKARIAFDELERQKTHEENLLLEEQKYKEQFLLQINNDLIRINTNKELHQQFIENYNNEQEKIKMIQIAEEEELKEKEKRENEEKQLLISKYYKDQMDIHINRMNEYKRHIDEHNEYIIQKEEERKIEEEQNAIKIKNDMINYFKENVNIANKNMELYRSNIEKLKNEKIKKDKEFMQKLHQEELDKENEIKRQYEANIKYYNEAIKNNEELFNKRREEEEKIQKELDDKQKAIELENKLRGEEEKTALYNRFKSELNNINDVKNVILEEKLLQEKYKEEQRLIDVANKALLKKQIDDSISIYKLQLEQFNENQEELEKKNEARIIELENKKRLEEEQNTIDEMVRNKKTKAMYEKYISEYTNYIDEQNKLIEEEQKKQTLLEKQMEIQYEKEKAQAELEMKIKTEKLLNEYNESLEYYKNKMIVNKKQQDQLRIDELDKLKVIEEENKRKNIELNKMNVIKYSKLLKEFQEDKIKYMEHVSNQIIEDEKTEDVPNNKLFLSKIDKTINYINDLNNNKNNSDYLSKLNEQYKSINNNIDDVVEINDVDIIKVGDNILSYENFALYNTYNFNVVPKLIFQTWPTKNLPRYMQWVVDKIKAAHPNFEHFLYDDNDCREFIKSHFAVDVLWAFDRLKPGAYKADLWRYCIMYIKGGIYLDIKMCPVNGFRFDYILKNDWYCNDIGNISGIWQGILVSKPNNPLYKYLIDTILHNVKNDFYGSNALEITGPSMMYNLVKKLRISIPTPLVIKKFTNTKTSTILEKKYKVGICLKDDICLLEYDEYRDECLRTGIHYDKAWKDKDIYNKDILLSNYVSATE